MFTEIDWTEDWEEVSEYFEYVKTKFSDVEMYDELEVLLINPSAEGRLSIWDSCKNNDKIIYGTVIRLSSDEWDKYLTLIDKDEKKHNYSGYDEHCGSIILRKKKHI